MLRRILLALESDSTSEAACDVALDLAHRSAASVTALAAVDLLGVSATAAGPGLGATYYAYHLLGEIRDSLRESAGQRIAAFQEAARKADVRHYSRVGEGSPWRCFEIDSMAHDLAVVGRQAHFSFESAGGDRAKTPGRTLRRMLDHSACPVLVVSRAPLAEGPVVVAYDGRLPAARGLQDFLRLGLMESAEVIVLHCDEKALDESDRDSVLESAGRYLEAHRRPHRIELREGNARREVPRFVEEVQAALVVVGAHGRPRAAEWLLGNTALELLGVGEQPVLVGG